VRFVRGARAFPANVNLASGARFDPEASALMISTEATGMDE
jgi:hypothetical protein